MTLRITSIRAEDDDPAARLASLERELRRVIAVLLPAVAALDHARHVLDGARGPELREDKPYVPYHLFHGDMSPLPR